MTHCGHSAKSLLYERCIHLCFYILKSYIFFFFVAFRFYTLREWIRVSENIFSVVQHSFSKIFIIAICMLHYSTNIRFLHLC